MITHDSTIEQVARNRDTPGSGRATVKGGS